MFIALPVGTIVELERRLASQPGDLEKVGEPSEWEK